MNQTLNTKILYNLNGGVGNQQVVSVKRHMVTIGTALHSDSFKIGPAG